ncbi:MAG: hypothetical protein ACE5R4_06130 [Armatimonadota bacterium]
MEQSKKRWQIPVLVIGIILLLLFGINAIRQMVLGSRPAAVAKTDIVPKKEPPPVAETTEVTPTPTPTTTAGAMTIPDNPEEELATVFLPGSDPFAQVLGGTEPTGEPEAGETPGGAGPEVPEAMPPPRIDREDTLWGVGRFPPVLPDRTKRDTSISLVGTIVGARRLALVHESQPGGREVRVVAEGDRVGVSRSVVKDIGPGSIRVQGKLRTHTLRAEDRAAAETSEPRME